MPNRIIVLLSIPPNRITALNSFKMAFSIKTDRREKPNPIFEDFFEKNRKILKTSYKKSFK